jgi:transposase
VVNDASRLRALKAVAFEYEYNEAVEPLLDRFRMMVNHAIWVGNQRGIYGRFKLITAVYDEFKRYGLHTHYALNACEVASAILNNTKRKHRSPSAKRRFLKLDNQTYRLENGALRIPMQPRRLLLLRLKLGDYQRIFLEDRSLKRGSITITEGKVIVAFERIRSKAFDDASGVLAFDTNELSLDGVLSNRDEIKCIKVDLRKVATIRAVHFERRRHLQTRLAHNQRRLEAALAGDRGRERRRVDAVLHKVAKEQVKLAHENNAKIVLEDLKGIRRSVNRRRMSRNSRDGKLAYAVHSKGLKRRLNNWSFRRLHAFMEYKANWAGISSSYVPAWNTSRTCAKCGCLRTGHGGEQDPKSRRVFSCPRCGWRCGGHLNAALNLLKTQNEGRWFSPDRLPNEVMAVKRAYGEEVKIQEQGLTEPIERCATRV